MTNWIPTQPNVYKPSRLKLRGLVLWHLLKPKAGALALTLNAMGGRFQPPLDISIAYPDGTPSFWQLASGKAGRVIVHIRELPIPPDFCTSDYSTDSAFRSDSHRWLAHLWDEKDQQIENMLTQAADRT